MSSTEKNILLVEGKDDYYVIKVLKDKNGIQDNFETKDMNGVDNLLDVFPTRLKDSELKTLGVVIDADTDCHARWDSLTKSLKKAQYLSIPSAPEKNGTIILPPPDTLLPRVGIWIMPDNKTNGMLEDFLRFLVPSNSPLYKHVEDSVANIPDGEKRFSDNALSKAHMHTWLAWQEEPGKPYGQAITAKYLDAGVQEVHVFIDWVKRLFAA